MNRYKYFDDIRHSLERAGLKRRRLMTSPLVCLAIGAAAGFVIGMGVAMLVAPRSGREIRAQISGKARQFARFGKKGVHEAVEGGRRAVGELHEGIEQSKMPVPSETYGQEVIR